MWTGGDSLSVFFFSSRRRHTRWTGDWSSDVCSSDLDRTRCAPFRFTSAQLKQTGGSSPPGPSPRKERGATSHLRFVLVFLLRRVDFGRLAQRLLGLVVAARSEERRVGKECSCGGAPG